MKANDLQQIVDISDRLKREAEERARKEAEELAQKEELRRVYDAAQKKAVEEKARQEALRKLAENARREAEEKKADEELQDAIARNLAFGNKKGRKSAAELFAYMKIKLALMQKDAEEKERREGQGSNPLSEAAKKAEQEYPAADIEKALAAAALSGLPSETPARARRSRLPATLLTLAALAIGGYAGLQFGVYRSKPSSELTTFLAEQADKATAENKRLREANSELSRKYAGIEAQLQTNSKEYAEKFQTLAGGLAEKYSNFDKDLANSLSELEKKSKEEMEKLNQFYKGRTAELEAKITELEKKNTGYQKSNAEIESLKDERASLIRRMEELNTAVLLYEKESIDLKSKQKDDAAKLGNLSTNNKELSDKVRQYENKDELAKKNKALEERVSNLEGMLRKIFGSIESATEKLKEVEKKGSYVAPIPDAPDPLAEDKDKTTNKADLVPLKTSVATYEVPKDIYEAYLPLKKYVSFVGVYKNKIQLVRIENQPLEKIPAEIRKLTGIQSLYFDRCEISSIDNVGDLDTLLDLRIKNCKITKIDGLPNAQYIDLSGNKITRVENVAHLGGVQLLDLRGNPIDLNDSVTKENVKKLRDKGITVLITDADNQAWLQNWQDRRDKSDKKLLEYEQKKYDAAPK